MRARRFLVGGLLGLLLAVAAAAPAAAHAELLGSDPVPGAQLDQAPAEVLLTFSEPLSAATVTVLDGSGSPVTAGRAGFADPAHRRVRSPLQSGLPTGVYVVNWRVVSADSHPVSGAFSFGVGTAAPAESTVSGGSANETASVARAAFNWLGFIGIAVAFGGVAFLLLVWPAGRRQRIPRLLVAAGMGGAILASIGQLLVQAPYTGQSVAQTINSEFGYLVLARIGLLIVALPLSAVLLGRPRVLWPAGLAAVALAVATLVTWPLTGHARAGDPVWLAVGSEAAHLGAVTVWLGGVVMLVIAALHRRVNRADVLPVVAKFSTLALGCVVVIAVTGSYQAWREVGTLPALLATDYGLLLTVKIAAFAVIVGLGLAARIWIRGRWGTGPAELRRSVTLEIMIAVLILAVTSVLTATPPARTTYSAPLHTTLSAGPYQLDMSVEPARIGANAVSVLVHASDGTAADVDEVRLRVTLADPKVGPLSLTTHRVAPGEFVTHSASFPFPGRWRLEIGVRTGEFDLVYADAQVTVR